MTGRALLKRIYVLSARWLGLEARLLERIRRTGDTVVLNLHRVSPERNDFYQPLHPRLFEELLIFLKRHFWVTTFSELAATRPPGRPGAVLSFDDGFYDFVEYAAPLLEKHGLRANQNVIPSCVLSGEPPWMQRLNDLLGVAPPGVLRGVRLPGSPLRLDGGSREERARAGAALGAHLIRQPRAERAAYAQQLEELLSAHSGVRPFTRMMALADVREMAKVHEIGAHSYSHDPMDVASMEEFGKDLAKCSEFFRDRLGMPMRVYAFPNGRSRPEQVNVLLRHPEIQAVLLVGNDFARPDGPVYPRFNIGGLTAAELRLEALGFRARPL